jgi:hypothetical protein
MYNSCSREDIYNIHSSHFVVRSAHVPIEQGKK